jgi:hypothetical protein
MNGGKAYPIMRRLVLTPEDVAAVLALAGIQPSTPTTVLSDAYRKRVAEEDYGSRYGDYAAVMNENMARYWLFEVFSGGALGRLISMEYDLLVSVNLVHFAFEAGWAIGSGKNLLGQERSRAKALLDAILAILLIKGAEKLGTAIARRLRGESSATVAEEIAAWRTSQRPLSGKVHPGSTDMSLIAEFHRKLNAIRGGNVAVFEYLATDGTYKFVAMASRRGLGHSERLIAAKLEELGISPAQVTRVFSELQPCMKPGGYCQKMLIERFPRARVTWAFEYASKVDAQVLQVHKEMLHCCD